MKILVANLGSTSFKYRLFDIERPGRAGPGAGGDRADRLARSARVVVKSTRGERELDRPIADHGDAVQLCLDQLTDPEIGVLADAGRRLGHRLQGGARPNLTGVHRVDEHVLEAMEAFADVAPAHNPPYIKAMRMLRDRFPKCRWWPRSRPAFTGRSPRPTSATPSPTAWATELGIRRWGFHGASHRYISWRMAELLGRDRHQDHLVPPGRQLVAGGHPRRQVGGVQPGHEPAVRPAAQQPRRRLRRLRPAGPAPRDRQDAWRRCSTSWPTVGPGRACARPATSATSRPPPTAGDAAGRAGHRRLRRLDPPLPGRLPARARRGRRDRLHGRHRRELGRGSARGLPRPRLVRHRARPAAAMPAGPAERRVSADGSRVQVWTVPTNEEIVVARQCADSARLGQASRSRTRMPGPDLKEQGLLGDVPGQGDRQRGGDPEGRLDDRAQAPDRRALRVDEKGADRLVPTGRTFVVVDTLGAGVDEMVLICQGSSARLTPRPRSCRSTPW